MGWTEVIFWFGVMIGGFWVVYSGIKYVDKKFGGGQQ